MDGLAVHTDSSSRYAFDFEVSFDTGDNLPGLLPLKLFKVPLKPSLLLKAYLSFLHIVLRRSDWAKSKMH